MKRIIAVFDFDGTITTRDTLLEFIRFAKGRWHFVLGFVLYSPLLIAWKIKLYPNWKVKQQLFAFFFKGMKQSDFDHLCEAFCCQSQQLIRQEARKAILHHLKAQAEVVIASASIENWVYPFAKQLGISSVLCTPIEMENGYLTGRFASANCYGEEKVRRILERYPDRSEYHLVAYGDSSGDKPMLEWADEKFYKTFECQKKKNINR